MVGRLLYTYGYRLAGPKGRMYGFLICGPIHIFMPIYAMVSLGYLAANGKVTVDPNQIIEWSKYSKHDVIDLYQIILKKSNIFLSKF